MQVYHFGRERRLLFVNIYCWMYPPHVIIVLSVFKEISSKNKYWVVVRRMKKMVEYIFVELKKRFFFLCGFCHRWISPGRWFSKSFEIRRIRLFHMAQPIIKKPKLPTKIQQSIWEDCCKTNGWGQGRLLGFVDAVSLVHEI